MSVIMHKKPHTRKERAGQGGAQRERAQSVGNSSLIKYARNKVRAAEEKNLMRKSLYDYQREKLLKRDAVLYYQRIFIFVKNLKVVMGKPRASAITQTGEDMLEEDEDEEEETEKTIRLPEQSSQMELQLLSREDLELALSERLEDIVKIANHTSLTEDQLNGLFLYMGTYSLIVLEGTEDGISIFCEEFLRRFSDFWANNKVFLVEDNIATNYFDTFVCKAMAPISVNEKFPPNSGNDEQLMQQQHTLIKKKLHLLCSTFTQEVNEAEEGEEEHSMYEEEAEDETPQLDLQLDLLKKHVPEVQRIELVLESTRFYRNLREFAHTYEHIKMHRDDEDVCWPVRNNYTPYGVYLRSEYDYNLTYPESNITSEQKAKRDSQEAGEDGEGEEGEEQADAKAAE